MDSVSTPIWLSKNVVICAFMLLVHSSMLYAQPNPWCAGIGQKQDVVDLP
jgi:hypothetical protein